MQTILEPTNTEETVQPVSTTEIEDVQENKYIAEYDLQEVEIDYFSEKELKSVNEFMLYFRKRLNQFIKTHTDTKEDVEMPFAVAGGFLSDAYMKRQGGFAMSSGALDSRDVDIFMQVPTEKFSDLDLDMFTEQLENELRSVNHSVGRIEITKYERDFTYDFISMPYILSVNLPLPLLGKNVKLEIIFSKYIERIFDFDISIRHFFSFNGEDKVYGAPIAIEDVKDRRLTIISPITAKSSLARLYYMRKRYNFDINYDSLRLLAWVFKRKHVTVFDLLNYVSGIEKFKYDEPMRNYISLMVMKFYSQFGETEKETHDCHFANDIYVFSADKEKQNYDRAGMFNTRFPFEDIFKPFYNFAVRSDLWEVLFANNYFHGFFGKFHKYVKHFSSKAPLTVLEEMGQEYINYLKLTQTYPDIGYLCQPYQEIEGKPKSANKLEKEKFRLKANLYNLCRYLDKETKEELLSSSLVEEMEKTPYPSAPKAQVPEEYDIEDIPEFLNYGRLVNHHMNQDAMEVASMDLPF